MFPIPLLVFLVMQDINMDITMFTLNIKVKGGALPDSADLRKRLCKLAKEKLGPGWPDPKNTHNMTEEQVERSLGRLGINSPPLAYPLPSPSFHLLVT
jgi:hypothetical protein